jgi:hypothetical protein
VYKREPGYLRRYSDEAKCWTDEESRFDSRKKQEIFYLHIAQNGSGTHPASYPVGTAGSFPGPYPVGALDISPGIKKQWREGDHLPAFSAEVKNGGTISPFLHTPSWSGA